MSDDAEEQFKAAEDDYLEDYGEDTEWPASGGDDLPADEVPVAVAAPEPSKPIANGAAIHSAQDTNPTTQTPKQPQDAKSPGEKEEGETTHEPLADLSKNTFGEPELSPEAKMRLKATFDAEFNRRKGFVISGLPFETRAEVCVGRPRHWTAVMCRVFASGTRG
eukprot:Opistho-2@19803